MRDSRLELKIGAPVTATDGLLGRVHQVILNPAQRRVVGVVVRAGLLPRRDLIVPTELIADATDQRVALRVGRDDLRRQPAFDPAHYLSLAAEGHGYKAGEALASIYGGAGGADERALVAANQREEARVARRGTLEGSTVALQSGQEVWATDGRAGRVDLLLLDASGQVCHFVIRKGRVLGRDVIVPVDWISAIDERGVWLVVDRAALYRLPPYRPDSAIAADVDQALWSDEVIRALDIETIDVAVRDGVVTLSGYATTPTSKARAERAARQVPGVLRVENEIVTDAEVVTAVAQALARDERTRRARIFVNAEHGVVRLSGEIENPDVRAAAEEIAAGVPQVRGVINDIQTPGVVVDPAKQRVLQPRIGQHVYAEDGFLGHVERVIVSPRHRRVTAFVVRGSFSDLERTGASTQLGDMPPEERRVVIPIEAVDDVTVSGVMLKISGTDATRYPDFDSNDFVAPDALWQPPYPYTHADVLLDLGWAAAARGDHHTALSGDALAIEPGPEGQPIWQRISRGTPVLFRDGVVGTVDHVWLDPRYGVGQIAVRASGPLPKDTLIPLDWVRRIDDTGIFVDVGAEQLAALPEAALLPAQQAEPARK
jgi:osmotically-inducible protein OsmY/sporulation protein YlmC with PRC-barrel domain